MNITPIEPDNWKHRLHKNSLNSCPVANSKKGLQLTLQ